MSKKCAAILLLVIVACLVLSPDALAGPGTGGKLPYESWVCQK